MGVYEDKLRDFLTHLQLERGASPHTVEAYRRDLIDLGDFVEHERPGHDPGQRPRRLRRRAARPRPLGRDGAPAAWPPCARSSSTAPARAAAARRRAHGAAAAARPQPARPADQGGGRGDRDPARHDPARPARPGDARAALRRRACGSRSSSRCGVSDIDLAEGVVRVHGQGREAADRADGQELDRGRPADLPPARPPVPGRLQRGDILFLNHRGQGITRQAVFQLVREHAPQAPGSPRTSRRTPCATRSPPTCSRAAATCAASRRCSGTPASRPPRCTRTSPPTTCARRTSSPPGLTRAHGVALTCRRR